MATSIPTWRWRREACWHESWSLNLHAVFIACQHVERFFAANLADDDAVGRIRRQLMSSCRA